MVFWTKKGTKKTKDVSGFFSIHPIQIKVYTKMSIDPKVYIFSWKKKLVDDIMVAINNTHILLMTVISCKHIPVQNCDNKLTLIHILSKFHLYFIEHASTWPLEFIALLVEPEKRKFILCFKHTLWCSWQKNNCLNCNLSGHKR